MDIQITRPGDTWQYDPGRYGYASGDILKTLAGAPSISSGLLRLNAAEVISMQAFKNCNAEFTMTIPTAPTAGDDRTWGLIKSSASGGSVAVFTISGTAFSAVVYDRNGTLVATKTINWSSAWTATSTRYTIRISERNIFFVINSTVVARFEEQVEIKQSTVITQTPLALTVDNNNSDNLDVTLLTVF